MTTHKVFVGGQCGDEDKGAAVEYATWKSCAKLVVRFCGGANGGHTLVRKSDGIAHTSNQMGSGVLVGAATYLGPHFRVAPFSIVPELRHLIEMGVTDVYENLFIDADSLITTPYHTAASKQQSNVHNRGTTGAGVGQTKRYAEEFPQYAIHAKDTLDKVVLREKLKHLIAHYSAQGVTDEFIESMPNPLENMTNFLEKFGNRVRIISRMGWRILRDSSETIVYEGSQGYWLDCNKGDKPYVTSSDVTYNHALELIEGRGVIERWLCLRMYPIRHGVGPFPTHDSMLDTLLPESHNVTHEYQGTFRRGWFDLDRVEQAITGLGGIDKIAMGHLDFWNRLPSWKIYSGGQIVLDTNDLNEYLGFISTRLNRKISILGYGPSKEDRQDG